MPDRAGERNDMVTYLIKPIAPFRLDLTVWVLRRLPINEIDRWDGETYQRVLVLNSGPMEVSVSQVGPTDAPELQVTLSGENASEQDISETRATLNKLLGLEIDMSDFYRQAESDVRLGKLVNRFVGFRPPRLGSVFETLLNAIACQQLSLVVGITLLNRLTKHYGLPVDEHYSFPRPQDLLGANFDELRKLGFSGRKAQNIITFAHSTAGGEMDLESLNDLDDQSAITELCGFSGIGRWSAEYVALRGLGRLNVFPADDVGSQNKLQHWLGLSERPNYGGMHQILDQWAPYRGLIYFYLLLDYQSRQGILPREDEAL